MPTSTLVLVKNNTITCAYVIFDLSKKKIPLLFSPPKKIPASFIDPKKSFLAKMSDPKKSFEPPPPPPSLKYVSGAPGRKSLSTKTVLCWSMFTPVGHTQPTYEMTLGFEPFTEKTDVGHFWDLKG